MLPAAYPVLILLLHNFLRLLYYLWRYHLFYKAILHFPGMHPAIIGHMFLYMPLTGGEKSTEGRAHICSFLWSLNPELLNTKWTINKCSLNK